MKVQRLLPAGSIRYSVCYRVFLGGGDVRVHGHWSVTHPTPSTAMAEQKTRLEGFVRLLEHASTCKNTTACAVDMCIHMKALVEHSGTCSLRAHGECNKCIHLSHLARMHADQCDVDDCRVHACKPIPATDREKTRQKLGNFASLLEHASTCNAAVCVVPMCLEMKAFVDHSKACHLRARGDCRKCAHLLYVSRFHAHKCPAAFFDDCRVHDCNYARAMEEYVHWKRVEQTPTL